MRKKYITDDIVSTTPAWYWSLGLHDAKITRVSFFELPFDYKKKDSKRNCFELLLDASGAIYDTQITSIRLYNYKISSGNADIQGQWWMCDSLSFDSGKHILYLTTTDSKDNHYEIVVRFDDAEVVRK